MRLCAFKGTPALLAGVFAVAVAQEPPASSPPPDPIPHSLSALLDGSAFARIEPGEFMMGSPDGNADEQPVHRVRISRAFEIGKFEVTQAQWEAVMRNPHSRARTLADPPPDINPSHFKGPSRPVENVSWHDVQQFLERLNLRDSEHTYRLPTEAEWEYAARAGATRGAAAAVDQVAWYEPNSQKQTHVIGQKAPNAWGLHDILGNVLEWVQDWYGEYGSGTELSDPQGPASGSYKVYRGCGWLSPAEQCRTGFRGFNFPADGHYSVGFRLVRTRK
jgi:formylglycine-generating enzyme required for sulfatase activity